ncbi:DUF2806 domain-containing protein [Massilia varians]
MNEPQSEGLAVVTDALSSLPAPVRTSFFKAVGHLLGGLTAIPAAKLKQYAQAIEDTTAARSATAAIMAKVAAEEASRDPVLIQAAAEVFLPTALRKAKNRLNVAQSAAEHLVEAAASDSIGDSAASPEDDWMNSFMRFAEDASSDRLQNLFGRILAGQVLRPGAFGLATLRTLSELDQATANDFSQVWIKSVGEAVDYGPEWQRGDGFARWKRLSEVGLMAPTAVSGFLPPFIPFFNDTSFWTPMRAGTTWLNVVFKQGATTQWDHIEFTRVGKEIGSLLPKPDYEENIRRAAMRLPRSGLTAIVLLVAGKADEVIWQDAS